MGCGASAGNEVPATADDPLSALLENIHDQQEELKGHIRHYADEMHEERYIKTTLMKVDTHIRCIQDRKKDEDALNDALKYHVANQDAYDLREASVGFGTDESKMASVIVSRLRENLILADEIYQKKYNRTIEDQVRGENKSLLGLLTGSLTDFGRFLVYRTMDPAARDAFLIHKCMAGFGCSDYILVEILSTRTNDHLKRVAQTYAESHDGEDMVERIKSETGGFGKKWYGRWVDTLVEFDRDESHEITVDPAAVATELYEAGEGKWMGCDEQPFIDHLCKANEKTCLAIAAAYEEAYETPLATAVEKKMGGDLEFACLARVRVQSDFFAVRLYKACKGWGTDEECIARVIGCLHKKQICEVEEAYSLRYGEEEAPFNSLRDLLPSELSGSFLDALLACMDAHPPKGHMLDDHRYETLADKAAHEFKERVRESYDDAAAKSKGQEDMHGPLSLVNMQSTEIFEDQERWEMDIEPMAPVWEDPVDRCEFFPDDPDNVDDSRALLKKLESENEKMSRSIETQLEVVSCLADQFPQRCHDLRFEERHCNQIIDDNEAMLEFCASRDADYVHEAIEGWGTDEDKLIRVLCSQQKPQLRRVDAIYAERYGQSLREVCDGELGGFFEGSFKYFMKCAMTPHAELDAELLRESMEGWGTDDHLLCELACTRSNQELREAKAIFAEQNGKSVEEWVTGDTSGKYESFLLACLRADRCEATDVNEEKAAQQAQRLHEAASSFTDIFCDSAAFIEVLSRASVKQVECIKTTFANNYGESLEDFFKNKMSGDWERVLLARILDKPTYYAQTLEKAFKGWGTDENAVSRVLGRNTKGSIKRIAERYEDMYERSLHDAIESETSGNFKKALLTMLFSEAPAGEKDPGFAADAARGGA
jgi:hypothetical protein